MQTRGTRLHRDKLKRTNAWRNREPYWVHYGPEEAALEHCEIDNVQGFSVEFERVDDGEKIASWSARMVANVIGMEEPPRMQDRPPLDREVQHEFADRHQRTSA